MTTDTLVKSVLAGDRRALARAITLIESSTPEAAPEADKLLTALLPHAGRSFRLAVSGVPGVGKSTFIEALGGLLLDRGLRLAVLAIDPSSPISGGSIMGDRTRMEQLSRDDRVFIRPTPTRGTLGGVARRTHEAIVACEAAGFNFIVVETVGVGQSETAAQSMVDAFLLLNLPNAGDELQGIKKGILELADFVAVNKADGEFRQAAEVAKGHLERAFMIAKGAHGHGAPPVFLVSSVDKRGFTEFLAALDAFQDSQKKSGQFAERRRAQAEAWLTEEVVAQFRDLLLAKGFRRKEFEEARASVACGQTPASPAARHFLEKLK